ncbi:DUF2752 domain-containing protein [Nocardiopsis sp. FIRDI 009]|uniref:DUF2752 domain-containing protein n=1 Tax=Nocardiopsis sp. FIRDI 009 TaxID=714197 RepID=UPI000E25BD7D|nr:DUF2752 domain-containing protein [Nocardiopsis sp. FIRDI 009]
MRPQQTEQPVIPRRADAALRSLADRIRHRAQSVHPAVWPVGLGSLGLVGATLVHFVDPNEPGNYPTCPWLLLTGTYCPGCGTTRAVALVTHGDILGAVSMNPLLMLAFGPFLLYTYLRWFKDSLTGRRTPRRAAPMWVYWTVVTSVFVFWVLRNLPWFDFLAPGVPLFPGW